MTIQQKVRQARKLIKDEQDGCTYLQQVSGVRELTEYLKQVRQKELKAIAEEALAIKKYNNNFERNK